MPLARETYLEAVSAAIFAGHLAVDPGCPSGPGGPPGRSQTTRAPDLLLDALAVRLTDGYAAAVPMIEQVLGLFSDDDVPVQDALRWLLLAGIVAADLWTSTAAQRVAARHVTIIRESGALSGLPLALDSCAVTLVFAGELAGGSGRGGGDGERRSAARVAVRGARARRGPGP